MIGILLKHRVAVGAMAKTRFIDDNSFVVCKITPVHRCMLTTFEMMHRDSGDVADTVWSVTDYELSGKPPTEPQSSLKSLLLHGDIIQEPYTPAQILGRRGQMRVLRLGISLRHHLAKMAPKSFCGRNCTRTM
jgi:hypothetical protein